MVMSKANVVILRWGNLPSRLRDEFKVNLGVGFIKGTMHKFDTELVHTCRSVQVLRNFAIVAYGASSEDVCTDESLRRYLDGLYREGLTSPEWWLYELGLVYPNLIRNSRDELLIDIQW